VGEDPLPNGVNLNRKALETVTRFAHDQRILPRLVKPEEIFAVNTLELSSSFAVLEQGRKLAGC
jgi:hypothetical protein